MNFTIYDVISHLIPGYLFLFFLRTLLNIELKDMGSLAVIAVAYTIGFIFQAIASWLEDVLFFTWKGKPSNNLLKGKQIWKVKFYDWKKAKEYLTKECNGEIKEDALFEAAQRVVNSKKYDRITSFNTSYAFSRLMTITMFFIFVSSLFIKPFSILVSLFLLIITIVSWLRTKQRGYYFAREVLSMYIIEKENGGK